MSEECTDRSTIAKEPGGPKTAFGLSTTLRHELHKREGCLCLHRPPPSPPLSSLEEIRLSELLVDHRHIGRVLYGKIHIPPFRINDRQCLGVVEFQDANGNRGLTVSMCNASADFIGRCSKGTQVAIKEPYLKLYPNRVAELVVDNPANMHPLTEASKRNSINQKTLKTYFRGGLQGAPPTCSDFVGPVQIRMVGDNSPLGRGLFLTEDVEEGRLLLVSNAVAVARAGPRGDAKGSRFAVEQLPPVLEELVTNLLDVVNAEPERLHQIYSLQDTALPPTSLPPMSRFAPEHGLASFSSQQNKKPDPPKLDIHLLRRIVSINAFEGMYLPTSFGYKLNYRSVGSQSEGYFNQDPTDVAGFWILPSFINHSCSPNSSWRHVGEAMFINASRDLKAGEQITVAYDSVFHPLLRRLSFTSRRGFICNCERCNMERAAYSQVPELALLGTQLCLARPPDSPSERFKKAQDIVIAVETLMVLRAANFSPPLTSKTKNWLRASFAEQYFLNAQLQLMLAHRIPESVREYSMCQHITLQDTVKMELAVQPGSEHNLAYFEHKDNGLTYTGCYWGGQIFPECWSLALRTCKCIYGAGVDKQTARALILWYRTLWRY